MLKFVQGQPRFSMNECTFRPSIRLRLRSIRFLIHEASFGYDGQAAPIMDMTTSYHNKYLTPQIQHTSIKPQSKRGVNTGQALTNLGHCHATIRN